MYSPRISFNLKGAFEYGGEKFEGANTISLSLIHI